MIPPQYLITSSEGRSFRMSMMAKKSSRDMDDTIFESVASGSDAFTSVAFDGDTSIDSNADDDCLLLGNDDDDVDCLFVDGDDDGDDYSEPGDEDVDSRVSHNAKDNTNDIEDPQLPAATATDQASVVSEYLPEHDSQHSRCSTSKHTQCSTSTRSHFVQRRRSEYAARRCKSVDMMTEQYMIHADEFNYYHDYQKDEEQKKRRRVLICRAICVVLSIAGFVFALLNELNLDPKSSSPLPTNPVREATNALATVSEQTGAPEEFLEGGGGGDRDGNAHDEDALTIKVQNTNNTPNYNEVNRNSNMVEVPFSNHHNLRFDGLLFVKDAPSSSTRTTPSYNSDNDNTNTNELQTHYSFDSYAKTLDPITEFHFSPGESTTSKHIVLTTTVPDLFNNNGLNQHPQKEMANDPGLVLSIGLEPNGQLWLPRETGQNVLQYEIDSNHHYTRSSSNKNHHHHSTTGQQDGGYTKNIYGPGDRFVLMITEDTISLFRNDHHELVGMWMNPKAAEEQSIFTPKSFSAHGLYAQVWFKEPNSSMKVNGFTNSYH